MKFEPPALIAKRKELNPFYGAEFEHMKERALECLLWRMSPEYWDSMTPMEHRAWIEAWNEMQEARRGKG